MNWRVGDAVTVKKLGAKVVFERYTDTLILGDHWLITHCFKLSTCYQLVHMSGAPKMWLMPDDLEEYFEVLV